MNFEDRLAEDKALAQQVLGTYEGRQVVWRILEQCGLYRMSFSNDSHETAFREGQRNVGLWALTEIIFTSGPDVFSIMTKEAQERLAYQNEGAVNVSNVGDAD